MIKKAMKISVVVPAYNEELFLPRLFASLKEQSIKPYEIIVVDNNSTDKTAIVAKSLGAQVIAERKQGYAHAANCGFYAAKGDIIVRADADYVSPPHWLEKIANAFNKDHTLIGIGGPLYPLESHWYENFIYYPATLIWMYILKALGRGFFWPNMAVRRSEFLKTQGWNTRISFGEDQDMCLQLKRIGKVQLLPSMYVYTSVRRLRELGLFKLVFGYSFANQLAMWQGKPVTIGTNPIRVVPVETPRPHKPWIYVVLAPSCTAMLVVTIVLSYYVTPVAAKEEPNKSKISLMVQTIKKEFQSSIREYITTQSAR